MSPTLFRLVLAAITLVLGAAPLSAAPAKYNVLFIAADDLRTELGCYGVPGMKTPALDKLSAGGVRFERAYCQFPLCNPSRSSMLTGRLPTTTGVLDNDGAFRTEHPDWITLPQLFKQNGYVSARTGKIYHGGIDDPEAWSEVAEARVPAGKGIKRPPGSQRPPPVDAQGRKRQDPALSDRIVVTEGDGEDHVDYYTALRGIELLEKHQTGPFFIAVGFVKPHSPPSAPRKFYDLHDPAKIELPPDFAARPAAPAGFPPSSINARNGDLFVNRDATPDEARKMIQAYRASASFTDWNVGRVLEALDRLRLADKTIVVFFGDHGYHLGEKGKWSKHGSLYEVGTRVPLIVRLPGAAGNGQPCARTVQLMDVYPTLAELCGLTLPSGPEGHSFASLLQNPKAAWAHPALSVARVPRGFARAIRTDRWRYAEYPDGAMLLDHQADPHERTNLASDPQHASTVQELKAQLGKAIPPRR